MFKLVLEKAEEPEIKMPTSTGSWKKQESSRKTSISVLLTMPKPLTVSVSSVAQLHPTLCDPMDCNTPSLPVHHQPPVYPNSHLLSRWCHPTISSSAIPFSSSLQSFPASGSFQMSQMFASGGQSIGVSASASVLPVNTQDWSPLGWTGWISFQSKGLSRVFSNTPVQKYQFFSAQLSLQSSSHIHTWQLSHPHMTVWITINCEKFWKRWEYQITWFASWEICMQVRKQQLELDMEQQTGSK